MLGTDPALDQMGRAFQAWLNEQSDALARFRELRPPEFEARVALVRDLQRVLFDAGWARYGWPKQLGGLGGGVLHRAAMIDALARNGYPPRYILEHVEILPPALVAFARPALLERLFLPTLRGDAIWCQGFSEPSAGSDLASLRTRAERTQDGFRIDGHKIWTSWAKWADHCLVLARTGSSEERHRALSAFVVDLSTPGVNVCPIRQANGTEELAEVFFDGVLVPEENLLGEVNGGWAVALKILAGERGSYAWLRHAHLFGRLEALARFPAAAEYPRGLGEMLVRLLSLRCRSREVMEILARGEQPGPESSVSKVMVIDADNALYELAREVLSPGIDLGTLPESWEWQESYLYSRASGIYGGTRQIQLNVIGKLMIRSGGAARHQANDEHEGVRGSIADAAKQSATTRDALAGLDWWSFAAQPADAMGEAAFAAWFEHQGRTLARSPALAGVAATAVAAELAVEPASIACTIRRIGEDDGGLDLLVFGWDEKSEWIALEEVDGRVLAAPLSEIEVSQAHALDPELVQRARVPRAALRPVNVDRDAHERARTLARLGAAFEILGAASALTDLVVEYTNQREQFGQPLSSFQAIQHMLSECQVDLAALASLADAALEQWRAGSARELAAAAKAFAGHGGRRVAQRSLQCFGAISFTDEHPHHRYLRRIHTLDALLGTSYELERELGAALAASGRAPRGVEVWRPAQGDGS